ncbi:MAG: encapsulin-associated ferritin-like protein [Rhodospirillales bacterium]
MPDNSATLHENPSAVRPETIDQHRAIASVMEELEAVDWYAQRVDATADADLRAILAHNRDEEKEHAAMVLEWLRRRDPTLDEHLRTYLFSEGPITAIEKSATAGEGGEAGAAPAGDGSLGIGSLKEA